jgi:hypothetical protein
VRAGGTERAARTEHGAQEATLDYDEKLAARVRHALGTRRGVVEQRMFGGVGFLLQGNICVGVQSDALVARVGPDQMTEAMTRPHASAFVITGQPMHGWVIVDAAGLRTQQDLTAWVDRARGFVATLPAR